MKSYSGARTMDGLEVLVEGRTLDPRTALKRFSSAGFEWGYEGPGPAQLAFAILCEHCGDPDKAAAATIGFMAEVVANFGNDWRLSEADIEAALARIGTRAGRA